MTVPYYSTLHVIVLLAHMALCRIKAVEQLQYQPPGELGKLLGLDRVPEVRCLRRKLAALSLDDGPKKSRMANLTGEAQESTNFYGKRSRLLAVCATK